jgi:hypothetical protein
MTLLSNRYQHRLGAGPGQTERKYIKFIPKVLVALVVLCLAPPAHARLILYASGGGQIQISGLYAIDTVTGAATLACNLNSIHVYAGGLAYDAPTDTLYATGALDSDTGTTRLFEINRASGAWTAFPGMSPTINLSSGGLAINPLTGIMYATGGNGFQSSGLFTIDKSTGAATLVGQCGGQCCTAPYGFNINGLGFGSDGTLFANGFTLSGTSVNGAYSLLFTLDLSSGLATEVGPHGVNVGRQLNYSGLTFGADGTLYSLGSTSASAQGLYSVNPATGAATVIGDTVIHFGVDGGLAFAPEPQPIIVTTSVAATNLVLDAANGLAGRTYLTLMSATLTQPLSLWQPVATNVLVAGGNFTITVTNTVQPTVPQRFYVLQLQ